VLGDSIFTAKLCWQPGSQDFSLKLILPRNFWTMETCSGLSDRYVSGLLSVDTRIQGSQDSAVFSLVKSGPQQRKISDYQSDL